MSNATTFSFRESHQWDQSLDRMSLHWAKRSNSIARQLTNSANASYFKQDLNAIWTTGPAGNDTEPNPTSNAMLSYVTEDCSTASDSLSTIPAPHNEQEQNELLAMIYPIAGIFPYKSDINAPPFPIFNELSSENLCALHYNLTQVAQDFDQGTIPLLFLWAYQRPLQYQEGNRHFLLFSLTNFYTPQP